MSMKKIFKATRLDSAGVVQSIHLVRASGPQEAGVHVATERIVVLLATTRETEAMVADGCQLEEAV